jgi:hypothetical protein
MPMNRAHRKLCSSEEWAQTTKDRTLPWALEGVELGDDVLEIGARFTDVSVDLHPESGGLRFRGTRP